MDFGLKDKVAVVTGSTAGIGFAIAVALAREGARVVVNGRTVPRVESALQKARQLVPSANVSGIAADLGTKDGVTSFTEHVPHADVLVNNLGIFEVKPFLEIPDEDWHRFFDTNVLSGVRLTRHYLAGMLKNNRGRMI